MGDDTPGTADKPAPDGWMSALAFHEKAGRCQVVLWLSKFISDVFLCPDIRGFAAGEAAVKTERSEFIWSLDGRRSQP
jgi:hypothetical protein